MTGCALDLEVPADQYVTGLRAVIKLDLVPFGRHMAGFALLAECALVLIVGFVAIETQLWRLAMFRAGVMAILTGNLLMRPRKDKIGQFMIELLRVESDNIRVTAYMLGMACSALL